MKRAFTLIELIISIVIIALVSVSLPMMLSSANKLEERTLNQDMFFKSITVMMDIVSRYWDNYESANDDEKKYNLIWRVQKGDDSLSASRYRVGSIQNYNYRYFYSNPDVNSTSMDTASEKVDANAKEWLNQYNNKYIEESTDGSNVRCDIAVRYVPDKVDDNNSKTQFATWDLHGTTINVWTEQADSTNLKRINVKILRNVAGENMDVGFAYFSSNIGAPGLKTK